MEIACTQRLQNLLQSKLDAIPEKFHNSLYSWHGNLRIIHNRRVLFFSNDLSLYSFMLLDVEDIHLEHIKYIFLAALRENVLAEGLSIDFIKEYSGKEDSINLIPSNSRRILGSMNELIKNSESLWLPDQYRNVLNPVDLNKKINRLTMNSYLENRRPIDVLKEVFSSSH